MNGICISCNSKSSIISHIGLPGDGGFANGCGGGMIRRVLTLSFNFGGEDASLNAAILACNSAILDDASTVSFTLPLFLFPSIRIDDGPSASNFFHGGLGGRDRLSPSLPILTRAEILRPSAVLIVLSSAVGNCQGGDVPRFRFFLSFPSGSGVCIADSRLFLIGASSFGELIIV
jgi:hypothetical protein